MNVKERFLQYVVIDSGSSETSGTHPSTDRQWNMARLLEKELREMGVENVWVSPTAYVYGEIPANAEGQPAIGLIAHMDTAPAVATGPVHPRSLLYQGGEIQVGVGVVMKPEEFESLRRHVGHELILTDGTTLLGGDDKAGIAEIMTVCEYFLTHPEAKHGKICIGFTPDEEIGEGADDFDLARFGADFAYTVDGGGAGEYECENFNADAAVVEVKGFNIHPGSAKDKMKNAAKIAMEFHSLLPAAECPEHTEGYEGFYHLCEMSGDESGARLQYILRDHDGGREEARREMMRACETFLNRKYGEGTVKVTLRESYRNMKEVVDRYPQVTERALEAIRAAGDEPRVVAIRGGTDGARLSWEGLPCPNLPTGVYNMHGVMEYASVNEMEKSVQALIHLLTAR